MPVGEEPPDPPPDRMGGIDHQDWTTLAAAGVGVVPISIGEVGVAVVGAGCEMAFCPDGIGAIAIHVDRQGE